MNCAYCGKGFKPHPRKVYCNGQCKAHMFKRKALEQRTAELKAAQDSRTREIADWLRKEGPFNQSGSMIAQAMEAKFLGGE